MIVFLTAVNECHGERTIAHWDKNPLGQKPTGQYPLDKSPLLNLAGWTKAHFYEKNRLKSFFKLFTLIKLLLQGISYLQYVFTDIIISPVGCNFDKQLNLGVKINLQFGSNDLL